MNDPKSYYDTLMDVFKQDDYETLPEYKTLLNLDSPTKKSCW
ncbi:MAG: hypothetical protein AABW84_02545 [Nanoarchaeota archaeon]